MSKPSPSEQVSAHIQGLSPEIAETVQYLRQTILSASPEIAEQIKWNSPAFYYSGAMAPFDPKEYKRDILVINLHRGRILLVLPTGARIPDTTGILEGDYKDGRRTISIKDLADAQAKAPALQIILGQWLGTVEK